MDEFGNSSATRQAATTGLAIVGFVGLIVAGIWLAVYSTRFVPTVVGRIGTAAVYLGSVFTPADGPSLSVISTASTTIPFGDATSTPAASASTTQTVTPPAQTVTPTAGKQATSTIPLNGTTAPAPLSGLPDLTVKINAIGYLATSSAASFVASSTVPAGSRPAVNFTIKNIGTNATGAWRFSASIPTQTAYVFQSPPQQTLAPGDSIEYTLGFDQAIRGANQRISITANFDKAIAESDTTNDTASTTITILGS